MPEGENRLLFSEDQIRTAFVASGVGMVAILVFVLILATSQPQGAYQVADDDQYQAGLRAAAENLDGFELVGEDRARIDIEHAMELVVERGVDLPLAALGGTAPAAAAPAQDADAAPSEAPEEGAAEAPADDPAAQAAAAVDGQAVYAANCASCHQTDGQGIAGAFPPLAGGHAADLVQAEGGREYLVYGLLYGVQGRIEVAGQAYNGLMPAWQQLSDAEIAAVLSYVIRAWDNAQALEADVPDFAADEIAEARGEGLTSSEVLDLRPDVP
jgi:mono/diheme cytochrome c family protein